MKFSRTELLQAAKLMTFLEETQGRLFTASELCDAAIQIKATRAHNLDIATKAAAWMTHTYGAEFKVRYQNAIEYNLEYSYTHGDNAPEGLLEHINRKEKSFEVVLPEEQGFPANTKILVEIAYFDTVWGGF